MAAFSSIFEQQQNAYLLDSTSDPSTTTINCNNVSSLLEEQPNNSNFNLPSFYQPNHTAPPNTDSSSSSYHRPTLPNNNNIMDTSSILTHHNKRKSKQPSISRHSPQSKGKREAKGQKQKKMKDNVSDEKNKSSKEQEEEEKKGYIHVRARRGQATDSHSLAERVRRERISERMKLLQGLVPGCDKVTGKALMLDEIINYVQSLQNQVEFLSMKLASLNPMFYDFGMELESLMVRADDQPLESSPTTPNNYHHDHLFPQPQIPNVLPHLGSRQDLWEVDEHRQRSIMNQSAFTNTFFSFH